MEKNLARPQKLEVHVQQARDIHNICIYHKQDVYAKLCLTTDPGASVSSKIVNGGGQNPVFDEKLLLDVDTVDSSLKCEIWMLSRIKNYLEDQLLGFALVPLQEIAMNGGKLSGEFSISSTDMFHSPAGFVQLSVTFSDSPNRIAVPPPLGSATADLSGDDKAAISCEYEKIEFPDLEIVDENKRMVSEIFGIPGEHLDLESDCSERTNSAAVSRSLTGSSASAGSPDTEEKIAEVESKPRPIIKINASPESGVVQQEFVDMYMKSMQQFPHSEEKTMEVESAAKPPPIIKFDAAPEAGVVQQEIVDMYMKSMQQFTESLAKMKLPMDLDSSNGGSKIDAEEEKSRAPNEAASRVFYGSRAFF